jgi:hypothetical protein
MLASAVRKINRKLYVNSVLHTFHSLLYFKNRGLGELRNFRILDIMSAWLMPKKDGELIPPEYFRDQLQAP